MPTKGASRRGKATTQRHRPATSISVATQPTPPSQPHQLPVVEAQTPTETVSTVTDPSTAPTTAGPEQPAFEFTFNTLSMTDAFRMAVAPVGNANHQPSDSITSTSSSTYSPHPSSSHNPAQQTTVNGTGTHRTNGGSTSNQTQTTPPTPPDDYVFLAAVGFVQQTAQAEKDRAERLRNEATAAEGSAEELLLLADWLLAQAKAMSLSKENGVKDASWKASQEFAAQREKARAGAAEKERLEREAEQVKMEGLVKAMAEEMKRSLVIDARQRTKSEEARMESEKRVAEEDERQREELRKADEVAKLQEEIRRAEEEREKAEVERQKAAEELRDAQEKTKAVEDRVLAEGELEAKRKEVTEEKDRLGKAMKRLGSEEDRLEQERQKLSLQRERLSKERDLVEKEREQLRQEKEKVRKEQERIDRAEKERMQQQKEEEERTRRTKARKHQAALDKARPPTLSEKHTRAWNHYESEWEFLTKGEFPGIICQVTFPDFPWPLVQRPTSLDSMTKVAIGEFLFSKHHSGPKNVKMRIRDALRRWHPDKSNVLLSKIDEKERETIREGADLVIRNLNELKDEVEKNMWYLIGGPESPTTATSTTTTTRHGS